MQKPKKTALKKESKNKKSTRGRKKIVDDVILQKLELAYSIDANDEEACIYAGISTSTLYNYQNENPDFLERKKLLKNKPVLKARINIKDALESEDDKVRLDVSKWLLERKRKKEFSTQVDNVVTTFDAGKLDMEVVRKINEKLRE